MVCPTCGAGIGHACIGSDRRPRKTDHKEREAAARALTVSKPVEVLPDLFVAPVTAEVTATRPFPWRFLSLDFESADHGRDSACAIGAVDVNKGDVVHQAYQLIRPPRPKVIFTHIHSLTWRDLHSKPLFPVVWAEITPMIDQANFVVAHNAPFERSIVEACCVKYGLPVPQTRYLCTMKLARHVWGLHPATLEDVCRYLAIPLNHHNAISDALAAAQIVRRAWAQGYDLMHFLTN